MLGLLLARSKPYMGTDTHPINQRPSLRAGGQYAWDIAIALQKLTSRRLTPSQYAQTNRDAITPIRRTIMLRVLLTLQALRHTEKNHHQRYAVILMLSQGGGRVYSGRLLSLPNLT